MKKVYGYIRVSTVKQGKGVSPDEQKDAIERYAEKRELEVIEWFEEEKTAAKQGRPLFNKMMKLLKAKKANGVIMHKIDRGTRNLKDWVALQDMMASGIELHFAHDSIDMNTRAGRLTADMLVAFAVDYIRNLKEEATKGIYGRLKQGIWPFYAPIGYVNTGKGNAKTIDKIMGPLVRKAFQLYATGKYTLEKLTEIMQKLGLRNSKGKAIPFNTMATLLKNPFYVGIMKVKGKTFQGKHEPLISLKLFNQVQDILRGKTNTRSAKHDFLFRRLIKCVECNYSLIGEKQKGYVYYRCQTKGCPTKTIREDSIEKAIVQSLEPLQLNQVENEVLHEVLEEAQMNWTETQSGLEESLKLQKSKVSQKLDRLTDAFIENVVDKDQFDNKKEGLMIELQELKNKEGQFSNHKDIIFRKTNNFLEHLKNFKNSYQIGIKEEKRKIMKSITSNLSIEGRKLIITMKSPFQEIANRPDFLLCALDRDTPRTCTINYASNDKFSQVAVDNPELKEQMKELLEIILRSFELKEEEIDEEPYDI